LPSSLYKYINLDKSESDTAAIIDEIFVKSKIKVSNSRYFNDRFDSRVIHTPEMRKQITREFDELLPNNHIIIDKEIIRLELLLESYPIVCMSAISPIEFDSDIMWGIYGGNGKGICLQFNYDQINKINSNILNLDSNFQVEYNNNYTKHQIFKSLINRKIRSEVMLYHKVPFEHALTEYNEALKLFYYHGFSWQLIDPNLTFPRSFVVSS
jgi:hypothetical protein